MDRLRELLDKLDPDTVGGRVSQAVVFGGVFGVSYVVFGNVASAVVIAVAAFMALYLLISTRRDPL